jgi:nitroreductase
MPDIFETIMHRRSIRRFEPKQIEETALQQILQAGLYAPCAGGRQGVIFAVCQDKKVNERLGKIKRANSNPRMATATSFVSREQPSIADDPKLTNAFYDAPTVITLFAPKNFLFSVDDCAVAAENMMLAADALGIGSCYIGQGWPAFAAPYGQEILRQWNIPADHYAVMQLLLGYAKEGDKHPTPKPRKEGCVIRMGGAAK